MNTKRIEKDDGRMDLSLYMAEVIDELKEDRDILRCNAREWKLI